MKPLLYSFRQTPNCSPGKLKVGAVTVTGVAHNDGSARLESVLVSFELDVIYHNEMQKGNGN
jgi:hypothetical protein